MRHAFVMQMSYTAIANGRSKLEERLARWLLMAHERLRYPVGSIYNKRRATHPASDSQEGL
jgi:hypothetical protein